MKDYKRNLPKIPTWIAIAALTVGIFVALIRIRPNWLRPPFPEAIHITGAVLTQSKDPGKQAPLANVEITASDGSDEVDSKSDASGFFQLELRPGLRSRERITLALKHKEYKPIEITAAPEDRLYVLRMEPLIPDHGGEHEAGDSRKPSPIKNVRVRYTVKSQTTIDVGSLAKHFQVANTGNVPCRGSRTCSPDGKWRATLLPISLDAEEENQFRNVRITCIAGPCPFTAIRTGDLSRPSRQIRASVLNWSDTAVFLVEAELTRTAVTDTIRRSYPTLIGQTMTFALPASAEGATLEADLNGEEIVFPLGPRLILAWATCRVEVAPDQNKTYRCELKTGYHFPP